MYRKYFKRTFDASIALIVVMIAIPIGTLVALLIRIDSKGPAIFKQKRTGLYGKDFCMYKFRTMSCDNNVLDVERANQLTTLGKIIRTLSLDEIPQLVNILKGEMSIIGPRPWIPEYYQNMTDEQRVRASVRPGISGLAQARGRNNLSIYDKINYDLLYVKDITFINDIKIIVLTIVALFEKSGAAIEKFGIHEEIQSLMSQHKSIVPATESVFYGELPKQNITEDRISRSKTAEETQQLKNDLVSIVIPVFNAARFLDETVASIQNQTYTNWEAIFIDDCSTDNSSAIIERYQTSDSRIKLLSNGVNSHAAITRNRGIDESVGRYIAFLDADDLWVPKKLEKQVSFMRERLCAFSFTGYEFSNENGVPNGRIVCVPDQLSYAQALKNTTIWTSTVMLDSSMLTKNQMHMPDAQRGQDTATWWKILRLIKNAYGLNEVLSYYRRSSGSLSSNKLVALKRTWVLYRKYEKLNVILSGYYFSWYVLNAIKRRV